MEEDDCTINFYMASPTFGGEYVWLDRIARKFEGKISYIWPRGSHSPSPIFIGFKSKLIISFCKIIPGGRGLFMNVLISSCSLSRDKRNFISTPYYPIPAGTHIAYIHTPSRKLTVDEEFNHNKSLVGRVFWKIFKIIYKYAYCKSLVNAKDVFVNSRNTQERISKLCNLVMPIKVLYPTQDINEFQCKNQDKYFFSPSRFTPQKNQIFLIKAFSEFCELIKKETNNESEFKLILAGSDPKDSAEAKIYFEFLKDYVSRLRNEIKSKIEFVLNKNRKEILEYYSSSLAVLYAGRNEDFGQIPVEGMLSCKPVVALNEGGIRETVVDGVTGYLVNTSSEMAKKMLILTKDQILAKSMGENGRKLAVRFDDDIFISKIKDVLEIGGVSNTKF